MPTREAAEILRLYRACAQPLYAVLDGLPEEQLHWKPAPDSRSIGEIIRHLIRVDNWFLQRHGIEPRGKDPGPVAAEPLLQALQTVHAQVIEWLESCETNSALQKQRQADDAGEHDTPADAILHMAQHYFYHLAQVIYLRRAQDRQWQSPIHQWEEATYMLADHLAVMRALFPQRNTESPSHG